MMKFPGNKLAALAVAAMTVLPASMVSAELQEYEMAPGDTLQIYVYGHEELSSRRDSTD